MPKVSRIKITRPTPGSPQAPGKRLKPIFNTPASQTPLYVDASPDPPAKKPDGMESRIKEHVSTAAKKLKTHLYTLEDILEADKKLERRDIKAVSREVKEGHERVEKRLDDIVKGLEKQLEVVQGLGPLMAETANKINAGKKRSASEAFGTDEGERTSTGHDSSFKQLERRLGMQLGNTQAHIELVVCEMKAGMFKRLANLEEKIGAMEEKMDRMARFMAKWEAVSSASTGPSTVSAI
ncbi:hypothetical protein HDV57DRAFT_241537 [Trichoderma longibrachiatum]